MMGYGLKGGEECRCPLVPERPWQLESEQQLFLINNILPSVKRIEHIYGLQHLAISDDI